MKKNFLNIFLLALIGGLAGCSSTKKTINSLEIDYDFTGASGTNNKTTSYGEPGQLINLNLKHINSNIYNVSVNDSLVVYENQKPDELVNLFNKMPGLEPVTGSAETPPANPAAIGASPAQKNTNAFKEAQTEYNRNKTDIEKLDAELNTFLNTDYVNLKGGFNECVDFTDMPAELNKMAVECSGSVATKIVKANAYITDNLNGFNAASIPLGIEPFVNKKIEDFKQTLMENEEKANELIKRYTAIKESADPKLSIGQYKVIEKYIEEKTDKLNAVLGNISKMKDKVKELEKAKPGKAIAEAYNKISTSVVDKIIPKYIPRKSGDEYLLKVSIEKKVTTVNCDNEPISFTIPVYLEKGIKIDFSTGVVFNFGRDKFFDQKYRYDSVYRADGSISDSVQISKRKSNNISQVSIGAFGHVYTRIRREINLGGMFGVSVSADQRIYYHAGLSALIGKNDRFVISTGVSIAKAKYLDTQYDINQIMKRSLAPTAIPVEEVTRAGFFLSLTYNLNLIK